MAGANQGRPGSDSQGGGLTHMLGMQEQRGGNPSLCHRICNSLKSALLIYHFKWCE